MKYFLLLFTFFSSFCFSDESGIWVGIGISSFDLRNYSNNPYFFVSTKKVEIYPISFNFGLSKNFSLELKYFNYKSHSEMYDRNRLEINSLMLNINFCPFENKINPYFTAGLNGSDVKRWSSVQSLRDNYLGWQAGIGLKYEAVEKSYIFLEYQFFKTGDPFEHLDNILKKNEADIFSLGIKTRIF